jgi:hypothetical protein
VAQRKEAASTVYSVHPIIIAAIVSLLGSLCRRRFLGCISFPLFPLKMAMKMARGCRLDNQIGISIFPSLQLTQLQTRNHERAD